MNTLTIEAEDYELYKNADVAVSDLDSSDAYITEINRGEFLTYTIDIAEAGEYRLDARVASDKDNDSQFSIYVDDQRTRFSFGNTGGAEQWQNISAPQTVSLTPGKHTVRIQMHIGGFNLNSFDLVALEGGNASTPSVPDEPQPDSVRTINSQLIRQLGNLRFGNSISAGTESQDIQGNLTTKSVSYAQAKSEIVANLDDAVVVYKGGSSTSSAPVVDKNRTFKIMPLGDSITRGGQPDDAFGYRDDIESILSSSGYKVELVGRSEFGNNVELGHSGVPGNTVSQIAERVNSLLDTYKPDAVLLMAGTNDTLQIKKRQTSDLAENKRLIAEAIADTVDQLVDLVKQITQRSPTTQLFISSIPPTEISGRKGIVNEYNSQIKDRLTNKYANTTFVDINSKLAGSDILDDKIHVSREGNEKIAQAWSEAFQDIYPLSKDDTPSQQVDTLSQIINVEGSNFDDVLIGNDARNVLIGGKGDDVLTGGLAADRFVLAPNSGFDRITDFRVGQDLIVLSDGLQNQQLGVASGNFAGFGENDTLLLSNGQNLALLMGVQADSLKADSFRFVV